MFKEYEEAAYSLKPENISLPIKSDIGYHLIRLIDKQGEKISTQHIFRTIDFSEKDKKNTYSIINKINSQIKNDSLVFDSLANIYSIKYKNYSGKYKNYSPENIPDYIHLNLDLLERFEISSPIKTDNGYVLIYFYNHQKKMVPNLVNSWNLIYNYTKQKKQNIFFKSLVDNIKNNIYIKIIND